MPHLHEGLDRLEALDFLVLGHALGVQGSELPADAGVLLEQGPSERLRGEREGGRDGDGAGVISKQQGRAQDGRRCYSR